MKLRYALLTTALMAVYAANSYAFFCPKNFNQIEFGDSMASVLQACGAADSKVVKDAPDNTPQEWSYFVAQQSRGTMSNAAQGTIKTSFAFDGNGKLININVNGIGVATTSNCGSPVVLGDTRQTVQAACGKPSFVNQENQPTSGINANANSKTEEVDESTKLVELTYSSTPPITLIFEGGRLTGKR